MVLFLIVGVIVFLVTDSTIASAVLAVMGLALGAASLVPQFAPQKSQELDQGVVHDLSSIKTSLLTLNAQIAGLTATDKVAVALFDCSARGVHALGFAVNNSGLIVVPRVLRGPVVARHLVSGVEHPAQPIEKGTLLQAYRLDMKTIGLIPAYRQPEFGEQLSALNATGGRASIIVTAYMDWIKVETQDSSLRIENIWQGTRSEADRVVGGPIVTPADEVIGVAVAFASAAPFLFFYAWPSLTSLIDRATTKEVKQGS
jgi:hypothetical protein